MSINILINTKLHYTALTICTALHDNKLDYIAKPIKTLNTPCSMQWSLDCVVVSGCSQTMSCARGISRQKVIFYDKEWRGCKAKSDIHDKGGGGVRKKVILYNKGFLGRTRIFFVSLQRGVSFWFLYYQKSYFVPMR